MIILHSQKIIIFRVPKTGSSSLQYDIKNSKLFDESIDLISPVIEGSPIQKLHTTPQIAYDNGIITDDMVKTYKMYAVIRNPFDRIMSAFEHMYRPARCSASRILRHIRAMGIDSLSSIFKMRQISWLELNGERVVIPILYDNLTEEINTIFPDCDICKSEKNSGTLRSRTSEVFQDTEIKELYENYYFDDIEVYRHCTESNFKIRCDV